MQYLSLDVIDTSDHLYPECLARISITLRGTKNFFDIFFSAADVEKSFGVVLPDDIDVTWILTPEKEKYLSYSNMKRVAYLLQEDRDIVDLYLKWIDSVLISNRKTTPIVKTIINDTHSTITYSDSTDGDSISDLDDTFSLTSLTSMQDNEYLITALQHKVEILEYQLKLKQKDIEIRDKTIELLEHKLENNITECNWI